MSLHFYWSDFDSLSNSELYAALKLRQDVFVLEQTCFYPDLDDVDQACVHLLGKQAGQVVAYLRLIPKTVHESGCLTLGRIVTSPDVRGQGVGKALMQETMAYLERNYPREPIQMSAQAYLVDFYQSFGFETVGDVYDEDGIDHILMRFVPEKTDGA